MAGVILRIVCSRAPYRRAGVNFEPTGHKTIVTTLVPLADLDEARLEALLADPHLDVAAGDGRLFKPVGTAQEVFDLLAYIAGPAPTQPEPARDTLQVIADHLAAEQARDAALRGGDDEEMPDTRASPAPKVSGEAAAEDAASGAQAQDVPAAAAPEAAASTPAEPEIDAAETAAFLAAARSPEGIQVSLTTKPAGTKRAPSKK